MQQRMPDGTVRNASAQQLITCGVAKPCSAPFHPYRQIVAISLRLRVLAFVPIAIVGIVATSCGTAISDAEMKAIVLGQRENRTCFVPSEVAGLRTSYATCYPIASDSPVTELHAGDCVSVKLPELGRAPTRKAHVLRPLPGECEVGEPELKCWKDELMVQPTRSKSCAISKP
jgi:hypothetical protein